MSDLQLLRNDVLIGTLAFIEVDQPWFRYAFTPGPGWESVRPFAEAFMAGLRNPRPTGDPESIQAIEAYANLDLVLVSSGTAEQARLMDDFWMVFHEDSVGVRYFRQAP